ncbi:hypothetical protein OHB07_38765 (plasmid) [Streptomyces sp. NBC_00111]|uniref:hypothetical protein n=1 Tax=unclassified Streptomyces TaxID=2593676 RepID=UPI002E316BB1|nr:hypothetical protein [Streptomyces sp. NBC_01460]
MTKGVRESVRVYYRGRYVPSPYKRMAALYVVVVGFVFAINVGQTVLPEMPELMARQADRWSTEVVEAPPLLAPIAIAVPTVITMALFSVGLTVYWVVLSLVSFAFMRRVRAFRPLVAVMYAVRSCGSVYGTAGPQRIEKLLSLAVSMNGVRRNLRRAHRVQGGLLRRGNRMKTVRAHLRSVVKCLDAAESRIDVDGDHALPDLVSLLDNIADAYADGRLAAILDKKTLDEYPAGRDWEALRLALLALIIGAGAVGAGFLALSDPVTTILIASVGVVGVTLLYRKNLREGIGHLEMWRP